MFCANNTCQLYRKTGARDIYSNYSFYPPVTVPCAYIAEAIKVVKTSVRVDASASRGRAEEDAGTARALFPPATVIGIGDIIVMEGIALEVTDIFPRRSTLGTLDHLQVDLRVGAVPE